jgi:hypothetical protein
MNDSQEPQNSLGPPVTTEITGQVAVGRFVLRIGEPSGTVVREASRTERVHIHPRPTPILVRPRLIRRLLDRRMEVAAALSALDAGLPVELSGEAGIGKTAILRHLAHHARATSFVDGIAYVRARHQPLTDLLQLVFEAFYESDEISQPTDAEIRRGLRDKQALILLDDVHLTQHELEQVLDYAPHSAFVVATRARCLWGEVRSLALKGLSSEDAVLLLEQELERALDDAERSAAASLCAALGGHPVRILQAAALVRDHGISVDEWARSITPATLIAELIASIDEKERRALLALTALPRVPLTAQHVSGIAELTDIEPALRTLARRGLVDGSESRHRLADGVADQLRRTDDLTPWVNRAITYFTGWAERYRRSPGRLLEESEALLSAQRYAADARRWGEVLRVGILLEGALVTGARWGAWAISLDRSLAAAKALGDRSAEAWALHEIGTRAVCVGNPGTARALLSQAAALRELIDDTTAAAASRQNLGFVLAPAADESRDPMRFSDLTDVDSFALRGATWSPAQTPSQSSIGRAVLIAVQMILAAGLGFLATVAAFERSWDVARIGSILHRGVEPPTVTDPAAPRPVQATDVYVSPSPGVRDVLTPPPPQDSGPERASILIFTPRPGSIASGGPTRLCYAVSGAVRTRLEPGIGEVPPARTLTCIPVTPVRTTTYGLDAYGRDGYAVRQQLVIVVR